MPIKVYLDDERPTPEGWVRTFWPEEVIHHLENDDVSEISLDHDLGDDQHGTGYDVLKWIEEQVYTTDFVPPRMHVHTANPVARQRMTQAVEAIHKAMSRR